MLKLLALLLFLTSLRAFALEATCSSLVNSGGERPVRANPLVNPYKADRGQFIDFENIRPADFLPAEAMQREWLGRVIAGILADPEPTFENTLLPLERALEGYERVGGTYYYIMISRQTPSLTKIFKKMNQREQDYFQQLFTDAALFTRLESLHKDRERLSLSPEQIRLVEYYLKKFKERGVHFSKDAKDQFVRIQRELGRLEGSYKMNILAANRAVHLHIKNENQVKGLPEDVLDTLRDNAKKKGLNGHLVLWQPQTLQQIMKTASDPWLRQKIYELRLARAPSNEPVIKRFAELRQEIADLFGYESFADQTISTSLMAGSKRRVEDYLHQLVKAYLPAARRELALLADFKEQKTGNAELPPWDVPYWASQYKAEVLGVDEQSVQKYFPLSRVRKKLFELVESLFGIRMVKRPDLVGYAGEVETFEVIDDRGQRIGYQLGDLFTTENKRDGAWHQGFRRSHRMDEGKKVLPISSIVMGLTPGQKSETFLTLDQMETLFHETGHGLHHLFYDKNYLAFSGTAVSRDFVEAPSQFMEMFLSDPVFLRDLSEHPNTGEKISPELAQKIVDGKKFMAATRRLQQLWLALIDLAWHDNAFDPKGTLTEIERQASPEIASLFPRAEGLSQSAAFSHIWDNGYSAVYSSYTLAEALAIAFYQKFRQEGSPYKEAAAEFRRQVLEVGNARDLYEIVQEMIGGLPDPEILLRHDGIE